MQRSIIRLTMASLCALVLSSLSLADGVHRGCCHLCGKKVCQLTVEQVKEEKTCFNVECEDICIPPIRLPWECSPPQHCGTIRTVAKLTTETYEVDACEYNWDVIVICAVCRGHHTHGRKRGCRGAGCALPCCASRVDTDLLPHAHLQGVPQLDIARGRGVPLETPTGALIYGPVRAENAAPVQVANAPPRAPQSPRPASSILKE